MFGFLKTKKTTKLYCFKSNAVLAWQITRKNIDSGYIPKFIKTDPNIKIWSNNKTAGAQITYLAGIAPNTSNKDKKIEVPEGCWIIRYRTGVIECMSQGAFESMFYEINIKED